MDSLFNLLCQRGIINVLIGDSSYGEIKTIKISMPYLSGPDLCSLSTMFGDPKDYVWGSGNLSRWVYMDELLQFCIKNHKIQELLAYLFDKKQFERLFKPAYGNIVNLSLSEIDEIYKHIKSEIVKAINKLLYFGGHELIVINGQFRIDKIGASVKIDAPAIKMINRQYISDLSERANKDIFEKAYDSAITKCRTLLEEVFCYVIEIQGVAPSEKGDIGALYKQVKELYNMHADKLMDVRINTLLSGLERIINAITEMRNKNSDAHGIGNKRINIDEHHARLFLNASIALSDFILAVGEKSRRVATS